MKFTLVILAVIAAASAQVSPWNSFSSIYGNSDFSYPYGYGSYAQGYPGFDFSGFTTPSFGSFPAFSGFQGGFDTTGFTTPTFGGFNPFNNPLVGSDIKNVYPAPVISIANDAVSVSAPEVASSVPTPIGKTGVPATEVRTFVSNPEVKSVINAAAFASERKAADIAVVKVSGAAESTTATPAGKATPSASAFVDRAVKINADPALAVTASPILSSATGVPTLSIGSPFVRSFYSGDLTAPAFGLGSYGNYASNFGLYGDSLSGFNNYGFGLNALKKKRSA